MVDLPDTYAKRAFSGLVIAVGIGFAVVASCNTFLAVVRGSPLFSLWNDASLFQILIASAPFLLLALFAISARRPWIVAFCATAAFWGFYAYAITRPDEGGGANIGLGLLMMFSPLLIAVASLLSLLTLADGRSANDVANGS